MIWVMTALQLSLELGTNLQTLLVFQGERREVQSSVPAAPHAVVLNSSALPRVTRFVTSELDLALTHVTQLTITREHSLNREETATLDKLNVYM